MEKLPKTGVSTDEQKQQDLDAYYKSVFDETNSELVSFNVPKINDNSLNFDDAEEDDWDG